MIASSSPSTVPPLLEIHDLAKRFGATIALDGVNLAAHAGQVHALVGENGAGKTTLMNIVAGAMAPDLGAMRLDGQPYAPESPLDARRCGVALIHQELSLCPNLTVAENIVLGMEPARLGWIDRDAARRRANDLLEQFGHPDISPDRLVGRLSLPAQQVVEICRALAAEARVLLMDEPTSTFQRDDTERLFRLVARLVASGIAVIYISHFLEEVREIADRYTVLRDGQAVDTGSIAGTTDNQLIARMVGRSVSNLFPERPPLENRVGEVVLTVRNLAAPPGLKDATFELRRGEILGIAGLMGSGRTELVRTLFGLDEASSGQITIKGRPFNARGARPSERLRQGFGYLSEDRKGEGLSLPLSIADNVTATSLRSIAAHWGWLDLERQYGRTRKWIEALRIRARSPAERVRTLSGGNQQKVVVGRLLDQDADVLLLDEPTRGIDIGSKEQVYAVIAQCASEGKAVLMVSSYLPELFGVCDRLAVMRRGRLSAARPVNEWTPESVLAAAIEDTVQVLPADQAPS
jgi:ribose transport system ATP-binding protein